MDTPTLVILSGLPGTGKSTVAEGLEAELGWRRIAIDELADGPPAGAARDDPRYWDEAVGRLLGLVASLLADGVSVIVDSVFMGSDRLHARAIARVVGARFRPIHTFLSDGAVWERRVRARWEGSDPADGVATWDEILVQRGRFAPWEPGTALFLDACRPVDELRGAAAAFARDPDPDLVSLPEGPFEPGRYHARPPPSDVHSPVS